MKIVVASIYIELISFLEDAVLYHRSGRLGKLIDAFLQSGKEKLEEYTKTIASLVDRLLALKDTAHIAQQYDIQDLLKSTSQGEYIYHHISSSISFLRFQSLFRYTRALRAIPPSLVQILIFWIRRPPACKLR